MSEIIASEILKTISGGETTRKRTMCKYCHAFQGETETCKCPESPTHFHEYITVLVVD